MWASQVHRWGFEDIFTSLLQESSGFHILFAQLIHLSDPLLNTFISRNQLDAFVSIFEDQDCAQQLISRLETQIPKD